MIKDNYKTILIIFLTFVFIIVLVLVLSVFYNDKSNDINNPQLENNNNIKKVDNKATYLTISSYLDYFFLKYRESDDELIYYLYTEEYANSKHLSPDLSLTNEFLMKSDVNVKINDIYISENNTMSFAYVYLSAYDKEEIQKIYIKFIIDYKNGTYALEFISENTYENTIVNNIKSKEYRINKNQYNSFKLSSITDISMCSLYFSDFKYNISTNLVKSYNKFDSKTKNMYFSTFELYQVFIKNNINMIEQSYISKYQAYNDNNMTIYVCVDNNDITYEFYEYSIMNYTMAINIEDRKG